jgi:hypothetical protein
MHIFSSCSQTPQAGVPLVLFAHRFRVVSVLSALASLFFSLLAFFLPCILLFSALSMGAMLSVRYLSGPRRSPRVQAAFL